MPTTTGHRKLLEQLEADGITTMFGNPGSSEERLLDEISRFPMTRYILGLQEAALVLIANGYAVATQEPTAVQLHCSVGTGNALGSLYQAFRKQRSPLVVIAGEAGAAYDALDAHMALDLVTFARPVTKYAARGIHAGSLLRPLRRCIKMAATPPFGPTFLAVPQDVLDQENHEEVTPTVVPETRVAPEPALIARAAELLASAENPVIIMGDGVSHAQAQAELAQLAETLGAGVWGAMASEINLPWTHPLYRGLTGHMFGRVSGHSRHASARRTIPYRSDVGRSCQPLSRVPSMHEHAICGVNNAVPELRPAKQYLFSIWLSGSLLRTTDYSCLSMLCSDGNDGPTNSHAR